MRKIILEIPEVAYANMLNLDGSVIGAYEGSDYRIYLKDMQGSTSSIVNQDMSMAAAYSYEDFGQTTELTGNTIENEICYTGALYDKETGLYYLNARYYDPEYARFISQDTYRGGINDCDQWHLYAYCANNPINYVDPSGCSVTCVGLKAEVVVGVGVYGIVSINLGPTKMTLSAEVGVEFATNGFANLSLFTSYYPLADVEDLKGWGTSLGFSYSYGVHMSAGCSLSISKEGDLTTSGGCENGVGVSLIPIPYVSVSFGYCKIVKTITYSKIKKTIKKSVLGKMVIIKKDSKYTRITAMNYNIRRNNSTKKIKVWR